MEPRTLQWIAAACGGGIVRGTGGGGVTRVTTDSRAAGRGDLFVALRGERFDGHRFLPEVVAAGVAGVVVSEDPEVETGGVTVIRVGETRAALGALGAAYRRDFSPAVVAVGGSNGKTTSKELLACLLSTAGPTLRSPASFNNDIGVPLTLLGLEAGHRHAVLEVGTNHPGELAPLLGWIRPGFGWITSIGREHLEHFGDLDGVVREEGALGEALPGGGSWWFPGTRPTAGGWRNGRRPG